MSTEASAIPRVDDGAMTSTLGQLEFYIKRSSEISGELTLNREHVISLNRYYEYSTSSSSEVAAIAAWLIAQLGSHSGTPPNDTQEFFDALREHAAQWPPLARDCKKLATYLASEKTVLPSIDRQIMSDYFGRVEDDPARMWRDVLSVAPVSLKPCIEADVLELAKFFKTFQSEVEQYQVLITDIVEQAVEFRVALSEKLIPTVKKKFRILMSCPIADDEVKFFRDFYNLSLEIEKLEASHRRAMQDCKDNFTEDAGIPREKMNALRSVGGQCLEARQKRKAMVRAVRSEDYMCDELTNLILLFSAIATQLEDVRTGANHLHTAWGCINSYVSEAHERILQLKDSHGLAAFMVNFKVFTSSWEEVRAKAKRALIVFSEADADAPMRTQP